MKLYTASSWKNKYYDRVILLLRDAGHEVYNFREHTYAFRWEQIRPDPLKWTSREFVEALHHPISDRAFGVDFDGMKWADACVLISPCGRSSHVEAGWFVGQGKPLFILLNEGQEPELVYKMATDICCSTDDLIRALRNVS